MSVRRIRLDAQDFATLAHFREHAGLCAVLADLSVGYECQPDTQVVSQHGSGNELFVVLRGQVRINMVAASGRQITYQILDQGELFGELSAIDDVERSAAVVAETECRVAMISRDHFQQLLIEHPAFVQVVLQRLARLSRWLVSKVFEYHSYDVKGRVYSELLRVAEESDEYPPVVIMSDKDMASRVGTTRENVTRVYSKLRKKGIVRKQQKRIEVLAADELRALIAECEFT